MQVRDMMVADVCAVQVRDTARHAAELMRHRNIGSLLVDDGEQLVGIVTDRDLAVRAIAAGYSPNSSVRGFMTKAPVCIDQSKGVDDALRLMVERRIGRLPVVDREQRVVGIVSFGDLSELPELVGHGLARSG